MSNQSRPKKTKTLLSTIIFVTATIGNVSAQDPGPSPYDFNTQTWMQPFAAEGRTWGGTSGIAIQSSERIFVLQRGETQLPSPIPPEYTSFAGSLGWNVLRGRGRVWENCIYVIDSEGNLLEVWNQWDHLFEGTDGPGPHKLRMSPYDDENRLWLIDETGHIIYVFSNDGSKLEMTLGEKNIAGTDETHYSQPQDVAFLPDGKLLIADGLGNARIVVRDSDGSYIKEFGERGEGSHQFAGVHALALGPEDRLYALDRDKRDIKVFQQTAQRDSSAYPTYEHRVTWSGLGMPLDINVSAEAAWVTDLNPPKIVQFNLDGERLYSFNLPTEGPDRWIEMHSMAIDDQGNLFGTDNQAGRPQKLTPRRNADPSNLVRPAYVPK
jgi:outer membrane protein assembly factor BamB